MLAWVPVSAIADVAAGVAAYRLRDFAGAFMAFQEAAKRDDVHALNYLGIMYAEGLGTPRNDTQAAIMFSKASLLGFPEAMANLARMHAAGRGGPQDNKAALSAYRAAARSGFQPAIVRMAEIYENGELGEAPDAALAREWRARLPLPPSPTADAAPAREAATVAAETPPPAPDESPDMAALAREARVQLPLQQKTAVADSAEPQAAAIAQNTIESVVVNKQFSHILIRVRTGTPLSEIPTGFILSDPARIVFDFLQTATDLGRFHDAGDGTLSAVDFIPVGDRVRLVLILRNSMNYDAKLDGRNLLITLTSDGGASR